MFLLDFCERLAESYWRMLTTTSSTPSSPSSGKSASSIFRPLRGHFGIERSLVFLPSKKINMWPSFGKIRGPYHNDHPSWPPCSSCSSWSSWSPSTLLLALRHRLVRRWCLAKLGIFVFPKNAIGDSVADQTACSPDADSGKDVWKGRWHVEEIKTNQLKAKSDDVRSTCRVCASCGKSFQ